MLILTLFFISTLTFIMLIVLILRFSYSICQKYRHSLVALISATNLWEEPGYRPALVPMRFKL
jgi:hypothetical protein